MLRQFVRCVATGNIGDTFSDVELEIPLIEPGQEDIVEVE